MWISVYQPFNPFSRHKKASRPLFSGEGKCYKCEQEVLCSIICTEKQWGKSATLLHTLLDQNISIKMQKTQPFYNGDNTAKWQIYYNNKENMFQCFGWHNHFIMPKCCLLQMFWHCLPLEESTFYVVTNAHYLLNRHTIHVFCL